jgi:PAS domain S-box-containing protein
LEVAQEALGGVTWIWNARTQEVTWFGDLSPLLGLRRGQFSGRYKDYLDRIHPLDREAARQTYIDCLKGRRPSYRAEERVVWPDGTVRWLETYARARYGRTGRTLEMSGSVRDCTERKEREAATARSEAMFARAFEAAPGYMSILRLRDGAILHVNRAFEEAVGRSSAEMAGRPIDEFGYWANPAQREDVNRALKAGEPVRNMPLDLHLRDGRVAHCLVSVERIEFEGEPAAVTFAHDVTEERDRQRALAESEERFQKAFHASQAAIGISRLTDSVLVAVNPGMEILLGAPAADLVGRTTLELDFWAGGPEMRARIVAELVREGKVRNGHIGVKRRSGETRTCDYSAEVIEIAGVHHVIGFLRDVTEQVAAEASARQSMARFAAVFDNSPDSISITNESDGTVVAVNDAWIRINGRAREDVVGRTPASNGQWFAGDREAVMAEVKARGRVVNRLTRFRRADGSVRQSLISVVLIEIEGKPCTVWIGRDVTDLQAAQRELEQSERRYRSLFQAAMDCIMVIAPDGKLLDINEAGCRSLGYTNEELRGGSFARILDETRLRRLLPRPDAIRTERRSLRAEQDIRAKDGSTRSVEFSAGPLPDGNILIIVRDVTDRKQQEALLANIARGVSAQLGESFLNSLVLHLCRELQADFVLVGEIQPGRDRVRTLAYCMDGSAAPNFEYSLAGTPCMNALAQKGTVAYAENVAHLFADDPELKSMGVEGYVGTSLLDSHGATIGILVAMTRTPIRNQGLWVSVLEIYASRAAAEIERASAEAQVRELNQSLERRVRDRTSELQAANSELESFSYSISHDLRAPVRAIAGFTGILRERHGSAFSDEMRFLFGRVEQNAARMGELIDDLLEFSRTGRAELTRQRLDVRDIVDTVIAGLPHDSVARVTIDVGELPGCIGDGSMLRQVWENLVGNAIKFSAHVPAPCVQIGGARVPGAVEYYVCDNGAGFDMEYASKLFGVFERLHAASEFEGTGVGLALVRRVVQRHGGNVYAEGAIGKGATFRFSLPE